MYQLMFEAAGEYAWRDAPDPEITAPEQAIVRPVAVACCDLDVAVAEGRLPMPPGHAVGHEGVAEVVAVGDAVRDVKVGDRVIVPFQISCGTCAACLRGVTGSCASLPLMAMYGMAPAGRARRRRLHGGPSAGAVCGRNVGRCPRRRRSGRHRLVVGQHSRRLARRRPLLRGNWPHSTLRIAVFSWRGACSIGLYAAAFASAYGAQVDYVDTDPQRLAMAEKLGATVHDRTKPDKSWDPYPITVHTTADPAVLASTMRATWPDGVCTDTGVYYQATVEMPLLSMYTRRCAVRHRPGERAGRDPRDPRIDRRRVAISRPPWIGLSPGTTPRRRGRR